MGKEEWLSANLSLQEEGGAQPGLNPAQWGGGQRQGPALLQNPEVGGKERDQPGVERGQA